MSQWTARAWTALSGAAKYARAMAAGQSVDEAEAVRRGSICAACPSLRCAKPTTLLGFVTVPKTGWCGEPFADRLGSVLPTCGCLVLVEAGEEDRPPPGLHAITINGRNYGPAGKTIIAGEQCPQRLW